MIEKLEIYTDGSYRPSDDFGAYGFIAISGDRKISQVWTKEKTTNNVMEIMAVYAALLFIKDHEIDQEFDVIHIFCDSSYVVNSTTLWWEGWKANGYRTKTGPVKNKELLHSIVDLLEEFPNVRLKWVKGHEDSQYNNEIDELVQNATKIKP